MKNYIYKKIISDNYSFPDNPMVNKFLGQVNALKKDSPKGVLEKGKLVRLLDEFFLENGYLATWEHTNRVSIIAHAIFDYFIQDKKNLAWLQSITDKKLEDIEFLLGLAARLHDIGKLAIPKYILYKKEPLTQAEFDLIRSHTHWGKKILSELNILKILQDVAFSHHEWLNGQGYPKHITYKIDNLTKFMIGLIATADSFEAMVANRSYRRHLTHNKIISELKKFRDLQWPAVFVDIIIQKIHENAVILNNKKILVRKITHDFYIVEGNKKIVRLAAEYVDKKESLVQSLGKEQFSTLEIDHIIDLLNEIHSSSFSPFLIFDE